MAQGLFSPLLAQLGRSRAAAEENARAVYGKHASALEGALQKTAAPIVGGFDTAIGQSAKVNEAVANRLAGQGQAASGDLAAKLAQISADPQGAAQLASQYQGAGNAGFVKDSADLQNLIGRRGEAVSYQGKLPGIARLTAAQALEQALSEGRGYFGEQESALNASAVEQASQLYGQFREEGEARRQSKAAERQAILNRAAEEKASLRALAAAAATNAEKLAYRAQEKALDRQTKIDIANLNAQTRLATDNPPAAPKPPSRTGPANQKFITVNGKVIKNPNYVPPSKGDTKNGNDNWLTAGSAKRDRVVQTAARAVIGDSGSFNQTILNRLKSYPRSPDQIVNTAINQALRAQGVPVNHPSAAQIRQAVRQRLNGKKWVDKNGQEWIFEA